jgi:hypothetical protein
MRKLTHRICAAAALACASFALANTAAAVDLRDWGRKYNNASERYVVLASFNNEAVLDKETQLVWQRRAYALGTTWPFAVTRCQIVLTGGRGGWRLPSLSELASLVGAGSVLPAGHPFLDLGPNELFWTSTEPPHTTNTAYAKALLGSGTITQIKQVGFRYLCVRGVGTAGRD